MLMRGSSIAIGKRVWAGELSDFAGTPLINDQARQRSLIWCALKPIRFIPAQNAVGFVRTGRCCLGFYYTDRSSLGAGIVFAI